MLIMKELTGTIYSFLLIVLLSTGLLPQFVSAQDDVIIALIDDNDFQQGFVVWRPKPKMKVRSGELIPLDNRDEPVWGIAQWHSRFDLGQANRENIASDVMRYTDGAKSVTFDFSDPDKRTITLGLDGTTEYDGKPPERGAAWPHLLVERRMLPHPPLPELTSVPFRISYRLIKQEADRLAGWDEQRHTAQFQLYITLRNQNRKSAGFGDFVWFGVPMYDARYRHTPQRAAVDFSTKHKKGTGKLYFKPPSKLFTSQSAEDGEWITLEHDLLPLMKEALHHTWQQGFLNDSHDMRDYHMGSMNLGWEVTGTWQVAMQVKGLKLLATHRDHLEQPIDTTDVVRH
jgi:hypothetical protein